MSDVVFDADDQVTVSCSNLNIQGHDFILDSAARRKQGASGFRRALVHDQNDGLTINFGNDYPGGVTINGLHALDVKGDIKFVIPNQFAVLVGHSSASETVSLVDAISTLRQQVHELQVKAGIV